MSPPGVEVGPPLITDVPPPDPDVLIEQARRRARRRRAGYGIALALALIGALVALALARDGSSVAASTVTPRSPLTVDGKAFRGHGELAFVSKGSLYVLSGANGRLVHLADPGFTASNPTLSHDGKWLAYLETATRPLIYTGDGHEVIGHANEGGALVGQIQLSQVWTARANGQDRHELRSIAYDQIVGWTPAKDELAVITQPAQRSNVTCAKQTTSVKLVTPLGVPRTIYSQQEGCGHPEAFYGAAWSPSGGSLAIATSDFKTASEVFTVNLTTGRRRVWFAIGTRQALDGRTQTIVDLAGWWPEWGMGFWVFQNGMTRNNDGSPLEVIRSPGARPIALGETLSDGVDTAVTVSPAGQLAIVYAPDRDIASGGTKVETCKLGPRRCSAIPGASTWDHAVSFTCRPRSEFFCAPPLKPGSADSGVTLDPAWSPDGSLLAYVRGPAAPQAVTSTAEWLDAHELFVYNRVSRAIKELPGTAGASAPQWSASGQSILFVSRDSLWLFDLKSDRSVRVAGPLFGGRTFEDAYAPAYYHQVPFNAQFAWRS